MWKCEACGTQGIAGDLQRCPGCGVARTAGVDGVQVPADAGLAAALAPVVPGGAAVDAEATLSAPVASTAPAPGPLAVPHGEAAHEDTTAEAPEAPEAAAPSTPDVAVPDGT